MAKLPNTFALTDFRANTARHLRRLAASDRATLLTQNGKAAAVVMSTEHYQALLDDAELARSIRAIERALDDQRADVPVKAARVQLRRAIASVTSQRTKPAPRKRSA